MLERNKISLLTCILLLVNSFFGQTVKLPCSDTEGHLQSTYFKFTSHDLDSLMLLSQTSYSFFAINGIDVNLKVSFVVDSNNVVKDIEVKSYEILHAFGPAKLAQLPPQELSNGRRYAINEIRRILELTNGLWVIGIKKNKKIDAKFSISFRFYTDAFEETKKAIVDAQNQLNTNYNAVRVQAAINYETKKALFRLKPYGQKAFAELNYELARIFYIENLNHFLNDFEGMELLGDCCFKLHEINKACENWSKCKKSKTAIEKIKLNCQEK